MGRKEPTATGHVLLFLLRAAALALVIGSGVFIYRVTDYLTAMSAGIILGLIIAFIGVGVIIVPIFVYLTRARQADMMEFLAMAQKQSGGRLTASWPASRILPSRPPEVWDQWIESDLESEVIR